MAISDWPTSARPREKLIQRGANALSDAELLAIFLRTGCAGRSAVDLANELLERFGSLAGCYQRVKHHFVRFAVLERQSMSSCYGAGQAAFGRTA